MTAPICSNCGEPITAATVIHTHDGPSIATLHCACGHVEPYQVSRFGASTSSLPGADVSPTDSLGVSDGAEAFAERAA